MTEIVTKNTLAPKIAKATLAVGGTLKADKYNKEQGYNYISADKILDRAGQALAEQGIAIIPQVTSSEITWFDRGNGKGRWDAHIKMLMLVTDGENQFLAPWEGWGCDYSVPDKAHYKAVTSGDKYFRMKLLSIGEGNEDSEHDDGDEQKPVQRQQPANGNGKQQPEPPAEQPAETPKPQRASAAMLKRWSELTNHAKDLGLSVEVVPADITADDLAEKGRQLRARIEAVEAQIPN